ncbi:MAG: hypothetical protein ABEI57_07635, partial [Halapricum sp.]
KLPEPSGLAARLSVPGLLSLKLGSEMEFPLARVIPSVRDPAEAPLVSTLSSTVRSAVPDELVSTPITASPEVIVVLLTENPEPEIEVELMELTVTPLTAE